MSASLHHGYCTFAVHHEKSLVLAFFKVSIDNYLFGNLESENNYKLLIWEKSGKSLEFWIQKFVPTQRSAY